MKTVKFIDVGRNKLSWTAQTAEVGFDWLYKQVKAKGALMSSDIAFRNEHGNGTIYAGVRAVGRFEVVTETVTSEGGGGNG